MTFFINGTGFTSYPVKILILDTKVNEGMDYRSINAIEKSYRRKQKMSS